LAVGGAFTSPGTEIDDRSAIGARLVHQGEGGLVAGAMREPGEGIWIVKRLFLIRNDTHFNGLSYERKENDKYNNCLYWSYVKG
jgi:hypothetical protein